MKIKTKFYNELEVLDEDVLVFPQGLPGFPDRKRFVYLHDKEAFFGCLQSCDNPEPAFVVISPFTVCPEYQVDLDKAATTELRLDGAEDALLLAIVTIPPGRPREATVNLQAPLVINTARRRGAQVIMPEAGYPLRFRLWKEEPTRVAKGKK